MCLVIGLCCGLASAETLSIAVGFERPPYVIKQSQQGYELELIRQVVAGMGYEA